MKYISEQLDRKAFNRKFDKVVRTYATELDITDEEAEEILMDNDEVFEYVDDETMDAYDIVDKLLSENMRLTEAKQILKRNGYRVLTESEGEAQVYLYLSKPDGRKDKIWFMYSGSEASSIELNLNIDYFKELLSKLGVSNKFFNLLDDLDWDCIKETYEYEGDLYSFGEAHSDCWDNGAYGGNNNPDFDWGGELTANLYSDNEDAVEYFLRNITAEALVIMFNGYTDIFSMYDYIDNGNIEDAFTDEKYGKDYKKYIDEFGVTIDEVVDFVNAMSDDNLIKTLTKDIKETPDFRERL